MRSRFLLRSTALTICAAAVTCAGQSYAQVPDAAVGSASAGRVEQQQIVTPNDSGDMSPRIEVKEIKIQDAPAGAEKITFTLQNLQLKGVTTYSEEDLKPVYAGKLGQTISLADLYGIAGDLTRKYRNDGYILTQIVVPPQTIEGGTATLQVVEGYVNQVSVQGQDDGGLIQSYASKIKVNKGATNVKDLERWMLLINDLPGVTARGVLSPSATQTGAADMTVITERDNFDALLGVDNYGSRYLGPTQVTAAASGNSLLGLNEKITAQAVATPMDGLDPELAYIGLNYLQPIFDYGTSFELFGSKTLTSPGFDLKQFDVDGRSDLLGLTVRHPFIRSRALNLTGRATFDYRNVESDNDLEETRKDRIRAIRVGGRLEAVDTLMGLGYNIADVEVSHGVDVFGSSQENASNLTRLEAEPDFYKLNAELQRLQRVYGSVNVLLGITGQVSNSPLYSAEEFGIGGISYGRGYDPSEILGDDGVAGKVELQWTEPYALPYLESYQLFGFYDVGRVWNQDATTSEQKIDSLASAGFGVRMDLPMEINAGALLAFPLTRAPQTEDEDKARLLFTLSKRF